MSKRIITRYSELTSDYLAGVPVACRAYPCWCGCRGHDSWHKTTIRRAVRGITILPEPVLLWGNVYAVAEGHARMPWLQEDDSKDFERILWTRRLRDDGSWSIYTDARLADMRS